MIYLIDNGQHYKIGYTTDVTKRLKKYRTESVDNKLIAYKPGIIKDEYKLLKSLEKFKFKNEWIERVDEVVNAFNEFESELNLEIDNVWIEYLKALINYIKSDKCTTFTYKEFTVCDIQQIVKDRKALNLGTILFDKIDYILNYEKLRVAIRLHDSLEKYKIHPNITILPKIAFNIEQSKQVTKESVLDYKKQLLAYINLIDDIPTINEIFGCKDSVNRVFDKFKRVLNLYNRAIELEDIQSKNKKYFLSILEKEYNTLQSSTI